MHSRFIRHSDVRIVGGLTLVISREAVGTSHADLSAWVGLIQHSVPHTWYIHQLDLVHRLRHPDGSRSSRIPGERSSTRSTVLGHTVSLKDIAHQGYPEQIHNLWVQWCTPSSQHLDPPSDDFLDLIENYLIPESIGMITGLLESFQFCSYTATEQGPLETWGVEAGSD